MKSRAISNLSTLNIQEPHARLLIHSHRYEVVTADGSSNLAGIVSRRRRRRLSVVVADADLLKIALVLE